MLYPTSAVPPYLLWLPLRDWALQPCPSISNSSNEAMQKTHQKLIASFPFVSLDASFDVDALWYSQKVISLL